MLLTYFACIEIPLNICVNTDLYLCGITLTHTTQYSYYICDRIQLTLKHTCAGCAQTSRCVFTYRLIHGIVQFTMRVAFRCTFHRAPNQHINRDLCNTLIYAGFHNVCIAMHSSSRQCSSMVGAHIETHAHMTCMQQSNTCDDVQITNCTLNEAHMQHLGTQHYLYTIVYNPHSYPLICCINTIILCARMILPQVHLRKPCYDFSFL